MTSSETEEPFNSIVFDAAGLGDLDQLKKALASHGHLIDATDPFSKKAPMHVAAEKGHVAVIEELVRSGSGAIDLLVRLRYGDRRTPMHCAAEHGHVEVIKLLASLGSQAINLNSFDGLYDWYRSRSAHYNTFPGDAHPIHFAAMNGHLAAVETLVDLGARLDVKTTSFLSGPMYLAAHNGHAAVIEALHRSGSKEIEEDQNSTHPTSFGKGALIRITASRRYVECLEMLFRLGCTDLDAPDAHLSTAMHNAVSSVDLRYIETLIRLGSQAVGHANIWGLTPLHCAVRNCFTDCIRLFIRSGCPLATLDAMDADQNTALQLAAKQGNQEIVELLIQAGSQALDTPEQRGKTPLYSATEFGSAGTIEALVRAGSCAIDTAGHDSWTPMHCAAQKGHEGAIELLVRLGSTALDTPTNYGRTPMYLAAQYAEEGKLYALRALKALGANSKIANDCLSEKAILFLNTVKVSEDEALSVRYWAYFTRTLADRLLVEMQRSMRAATSVSKPVEVGQQPRKPPQPTRVELRPREEPRKDHCLLC